MLWPNQSPRSTTSEWNYGNSTCSMMIQIKTLLGLTLCYLPGTTSDHHNGTLGMNHATETAQTCLSYSVIAHFHDVDQRNGIVPSVTFQGMLYPNLVHQEKNHQTIAPIIHAQLLDMLFIPVAILILYFLFLHCLLTEPTKWFLSTRAQFHVGSLECTTIIKDGVWEGVYKFLDVD